MAKHKRQRGFFTIAQNGSVDYLRHAYALALSLKATQSRVPHLSVGITPGMTVPEHYRAAFDEVIPIPWNDEADGYDWKLQNEWKVYHISPYVETIKLDADMLFFQDIADWWPLLAQQDVWAATTALTFRGEVACSDYYRRTFTVNRLPNVYTAFMYFKQSAVAQDLFTMAEIIFQNWQRFFFLYLTEPRPTEVSTDVVFALAMHLLDITDHCTRPGDFPAFVHMKSRMQNWPDQEFTEDWTKHWNVYFTRDLVCKIGRYRQLAPLHYQVKSFLTDEMIGAYERRVR